MKMNGRDSRIVSIYKQFKSELAGHMELTIAQAGKVMEDLYDALDALVWEREYDDDIDYRMMDACRSLIYKGVVARLPESLRSEWWMRR